MGPIRASRKRKTTEAKKAENDAVSGAVALVPGEWWDEMSKTLRGPLPVSKEVTKFESIFKISRKTFNYISSLVNEDLTKRTSFTFTNGKVLNVDDQVAVALRRLSSGESLAHVGSLFGISHSTVAQVTWRFVEVMEKRAIHHLRWPNSEAEMDIIKSKFEKIWGLPNCCGLIDTTHIMMCLPTISASKVWVDLEENYSMVLQAVLDSDMRFRDVVTGWPGSMNEIRVLHSSGLFKQCEKGLRLNGKKMVTSEGSELGEYIIGDSSFPLLPWLMTPYGGKDLSESETEFNRRHFATRTLVQRALTRLKETWRIIHGEMWMPDKHRLPRIILVCCLLHNIIIDMEDDLIDKMSLSIKHDSGYKQKFCNVVDANGAMLRQKLSHYMSGRRIS